MTSNVIPLRRPVVEPTAGELAEQVAVLAELVIEFARDADEMRRRLADLEARTPKPRFTIPPGWIAFKTAVAESGLSRSTLYRKIRRGEVVAVKVGVVTAIDPATLPGVGL